MKDLRQDPYSKDFKFDPGRFNQTNFTQQPTGQMSGDALDNLRRRRELQELYLNSERSQGEAQARGDTNQVQADMDYRGRLEKDMLPFLVEDTAQEFRGKGYQDDVFNPLKNTMLRDLASSSKSANQDAARRGLLGGGISEGNQAKLTANASANISKARQDVSSAAEEQAKGLENAQINNGIQLRNMQQGVFNNIYNSALQAYQARNSGLLGQAKQLAKIGSYGNILGGSQGALAGAGEFYGIGKMT
jgi:hypothetical protein